MLSLHIRQISPALFLLNYPKNFLLLLSSMAHSLWPIWVIRSLGVISRLYKVMSYLFCLEPSFKHGAFWNSLVLNQFRELKPGWLRWSQESVPDTTLPGKQKQRIFVLFKHKMTNLEKDSFFVVGVTTFQRVFWNSHSIVLNLRVLQL